MLDAPDLTLTPTVSAPTMKLCVSYLSIYLYMRYKQRISYLI
jgi:hypothetical protein